MSPEAAAYGFHMRPLWLAARSSARVRGESCAVYSEGYAALRLGEVEASTRTTPPLKSASGPRGSACSRAACSRAAAAAAAVVVVVMEDAVVGTGGEAARLQQAGGGEEVVGAAVRGSP